jgi:signal transduction histidine kinase
MATVSHELRTPLNSILGWARLLNDGQLDPSQQDRAVSTIIRSSENQNRLIEDLLDVARLISGKLELDIQQIELAELIDHSIDSLRLAAEIKNINIDFSDRPEDPCIIEGDRNRLVQVFSNLIENGIKFSDRDSKITITMLPCDREATVFIRDEGIGISKGFLPAVFERFRQDEKGGQQNAGLGLGLAIVRNLVELHSGSVAVTSEGEGKGSEFTVTLPLYQHEEPAASDDLPHDVDKSIGDDIGTVG